MPEKSNGKPAAKVVSVETAESEKKQETKFKIEKLRQNCMQLFRVSTSTFDGAMYGTKATEMTINEADAVINKWLGRKE